MYGFSAERPRLCDVGEKAFLQQMLPKLPVHPAFLNGFGDDSAVIDLALPDKTVLVTKIDRAAKPMATRRGWADYRLWGRLAVTATCSDILATGGAPRAIMAAILLPRDFPVQHAEEIIAGCVEECQRYDVAFVGGDTKEALNPEVIGAGFGVAKKGKTVSRLGAEPGDLFVLAGELGGFLGAYLQMDAEGTRADPFWDDWREYITMPTARWAEATAMSASGIVVSATDTSDGLYHALSVLANGAGALIMEDFVPYHAFAYHCATRLGIQPLNLALGVGDWNILYVIKRRDSGRIKKLASEGLSLRIIGEVTEQKGVEIIDTTGTPRRLREIVNEHFSSRQEDASDFLQAIHCSPFVTKSTSK